MCVCGGGGGASQRNSVYLHMYNPYYCILSPKSGGGGGLGDIPPRMELCYQ